jgi:methyl-accepting chemotaxis protein
MNLLNSTSIKGRLIFLTGLALVGLLATAFIGLLQLSRFNGSVASDLRTLDTGTSVMLEVATANVDFKTQVQEWKNILIRGNDPESFEKYKKQFQDKADKVQQRLQKVQSALQTAGSPYTKDVEKLAASHKEMLDKYLSALKTFDPANPEAGKIVDKSVKGIDRAATDAMNKLSQVLEKDISSDFSRIIQSNQSDYVTSRNALLLTTAVVIILVIRPGPWRPSVASRIAYTCFRSPSRLLRNVLI